MTAARAGRPSGRTISHAIIETQPHPRKATTLRLLLYGLNFSPELTGIGKYTGELATWLAVRGHEVHVVTAPPYYPAWKIGPTHRNTFATEHPAPNLTVFRTPLYVPAKPTGIKRMAHLASFMLGSIPTMLRQAFWQPEVVFTVEPTFFGAPLALLIAAAAGCPSWLHVQDFEVDAAFDLGLLPAHGPIHSLALTLERLFTSAFTRVSSISLKMVERALTKGLPPSRVTLFPNWVDIDAIHPLPPGDPNNPIREALSAGTLSAVPIPDIAAKILVLYSGNMGAKQGLELLAPLAASFSPTGPHPDPRLHFVFCGDGAFRPQLEALVAGHANVTLLPLQPLDRLNALLNAADIHLLPQRAGAADLVMPSKLTGMLSSGRPIVATADPGTQVADVVAGTPGPTEPVGHPPCGLVVPAESPAALHAAIHRLANDPVLRAQLGANARNYAVQHLGTEQVLTRFERDLLTLVPSRTPQSPI